MSPSLNSQSAIAAAGMPPPRISSSPAEIAFGNFDLREALSATVVRELSFAEFRAALELVGKKPS